MGICGLQWIDFVVYPFEAMKDTRLAFDKEYFYHAVSKANTCAKCFIPLAMASIWFSTLCNITELDRTPQGFFFPEVPAFKLVLNNIMRLNKRIR